MWEHGRHASNFIFIFLQKNYDGTKTVGGEGLTNLKEALRNDELKVNQFIFDILRNLI